MNTPNSSRNAASTEATPVPPAQVAYEAPVIESVVTSDDLAREVLYAGGTPISGTPPVIP